MESTLAPPEHPNLDGVRVAGRLLGDYVPLGSPGTGDHEHSLENIVGYVVRKTVSEGERLIVGDAPADVRGEIGYDLAVFDGGNRYSDALACAYEHRAGSAEYAVVDSLYACGCRPW